MKVVVMGQGYVGLPLGMAAAKVRHQVVGYEPDLNRYCSLLEGESYIEDVKDSVLEAAIRDDFYTAAGLGEEDLLIGFDVAVITVPTPLTKGSPDLSYVESAASTVARYLKDGALVVLESTVAPGTTREVVVPILEAGSGLKAGRDFCVGYSPERIDPGNKTWGFEQTPKIVAGMTSGCLERVKEFYDELVDTIVPAENLEEAELAKVFENTFRQVNIALVNELARHSKLLGTDVNRALSLCETKPHGFMKFTPGPGVGGHCIPVDPVFLSAGIRDVGGSFRLAELAQDINDSQPAWVVQRLQTGFTKRRIHMYGARVLAVGQAYKPGTSDTRESPAAIVTHLLRQAGARVTTLDPLANADLTELPDAVTLGCDFDAIVVLTAHPELPLTEISVSGVYVLDTTGKVPRSPAVEGL